jgi:hypothetical protein
MKKVLCVLLIIFLAIQSRSQNVKIEIITKQNDTLREYKLKRSYDFENLMVLDLQQKLVVYDDKKQKKEFLPNEIKSFNFINNGTLVEFVNLKDELFGLIMYSNKLKLLKVIKPGYTTVNIYVVVRPNEGKISFMEAMGLSRLISKKVLTREITDCPSVLEKVENKVLKIHGEEGVIELVKEYESTCFN